MSAENKAGPDVARVRVPLVDRFACTLNAFAVEPTPGEPSPPI